MHFPLFLSPQVTCFKETDLRIHDLGALKAKAIWIFHTGLMSKWCDKIMLYRCIQLSTSNKKRTVLFSLVCSNILIIKTGLFLLVL